jgi:hypothetical protein
MPKWVEILICRYLARILGMKQLRRERREDKIDKQMLLLNMQTGNSKTEMMELTGVDISNNNNKTSSDLMANNSGNTNHRHSKNNSEQKNKKKFDHQLQNSLFMSNHDIVSPRATLLRRENSTLSHTTESQQGDTSTFLLNKYEANGLRKSLNYILKELRVITQKIKTEESNEIKSLNWKFAAMVIDRLCMVFFTVATLFSAALILFTSKNIFKSSNPHPKF